MFGTRNTNVRDMENLAVLLQEPEGDFIVHDIFSNNRVWMCHHGFGGVAKYIEIDWFTLPGRFLHIHKNSRSHFAGEKVELGFFSPFRDSRVYFRDYAKGYEAYDRIDAVLEQVIGKEIELVHNLRLFLLK